MKNEKVSINIKSGFKCCYHNLTSSLEHEGIGYSCVIEGLQLCLKNIE